MGNMTLFIAGIAILSLGTYNAFGGRSSAATGVFRARPGAALRCGDGVALSVGAGDHLFEGEHFAGMARVLGVGLAVFLAWRRCR